MWNGLKTDAICPNHVTKYFRKKWICRKNLVVVNFEPNWIVIMIEFKLIQNCLARIELSSFIFKAENYITTATMPNSHFSL